MFILSEIRQTESYGYFVLYSVFRYTVMGDRYSFTQSSFFTQGNFIIYLSTTFCGITVWNKSSIISDVWIYINRLAVFTSFRSRLIEQIRLYCGMLCLLIVQDQNDLNAARTDFSVLLSCGAEAFCYCY